VIVGGGLVGASLALALAPARMKVAVVEAHAATSPPADDAWDVRVYAISPGNAAFLERCGAWSRVAPERIARVEAMRVHGDAPGARLEFSAYDAGLRELAFIVENGRLQHALWECLTRAPHLTLFAAAECARLAWEPDAVTLTLSDGAAIRSSLVVGADGAESWVRREAGITAKPVPYGELGVVANFSTTCRHQGIAYQWFRRDGVLALLPLPGNRISMVWSTSEEHGRHLLGLDHEALAASVEAASGETLGALSVVTPPAAFPLKLQRVAQFVRPRLALVGDAAHNVHPLAGQGVNLGFRDARELANVLADRGPQRDCGDYYLLRRYERARREDVAALQFTTDGLRRLFAEDRAWIGRARNWGLNWMDALPPLKNLLVRRAVS